VDMADKYVRSATSDGCGGGHGGADKDASSAASEDKVMMRDCQIRL